MNQAIVLQNRGQPAQAAQLIFALRRGPVRLDHDESEPALALFEGRRRLFLVWRTPVPRFQEITLQLSFQGERIRIVHTEWSDSETVQELLQSQLDPDRLKYQLSQLFSVQPTPAADILSWRETRAGPSADKGFFNDIDRETWPDDSSVWSDIPDPSGIGNISDAARDQALDGVLKRLQGGARKRQLQPISSPVASPYIALTGQPKTELEAISAIFRYCWNNNFAAQPDAIKLAFMRFATGHLMLLDNTDLPEPNPVILDWKSQACQPNSGLYFFFAELADLCIRSNVDTAFWTLLFPALVRSAKDFWTCYHTSMVPIGISDSVDKSAPFTSAVAEGGLAADLSAFETGFGASLQGVLRNYTQQYLAPVPAPSP